MLWNQLWESPDSIITLICNHRSSHSCGRLLCNSIIGLLFLCVHVCVCYLCGTLLFKNLFKKNHSIWSLSSGLFFDLYAFWLLNRNRSFFPLTSILQLCIVSYELVKCVHLADLKTYSRQVSIIRPPTIPRTEIVIMNITVQLIRQFIFFLASLNKTKSLLFTRLIWN